MPERNPSARPTNIVGSVLMSGDPNTGQQLFTANGTKTFTQYSGTAGGDANIWVGAGRLNGVYTHPGLTQLALSGQFISFYDSATAVSGGPLATSGHKIIGGIGLPQSLAPAASGDLIVGGQYFPLGLVFTSGLCFQSRSGVNGWTADYTAVVSGTVTG